MKIRMFVVGMILTAVSLVTPRVFGETLEEVEKKIADNMTKNKSISYKMKSNTDMKTPDMQMKYMSEGMMEMARKGEVKEGKFMTRIESKNTGTRKIGDGKEEKDDSKVLVIYDGEFSWTYSEAGDQKTAMKMKPDKKMNWNPFDGKSMFEESHKHFDFKLLPDETIDGKAMYVIEMTAKKSEGADSAQAGFNRLVNYYRKDNGVSVKTVSYNKDGKVTQTSTISDIKIDEEIKPERFVFKAPAGVEVMDMTKSQEPPPENKEAKADDKPAPKEQPKEEPKPEEKPKKKGLGGLIPKVK